MCLVDKSHTHHIRFSKDLHAQTLTKLEEEIAMFDSVLDRIQRLILDSMHLYVHIIQIRHAIFRLEQGMQGCETVEFAAPWIEEEEEHFDDKDDADSLLQDEEGD